MGGTDLRKETGASEQQASRMSEGVTPTDIRTLKVGLAANALYDIGLWFLDALDALPVLAGVALLVVYLQIRLRLAQRLTLALPQEDQKALPGGSSEVVHRKDLIISGGSRRPGGPRYLALAFLLLAIAVIGGAGALVGGLMNDSGRVITVPGPAITVTETVFRTVESEETKTSDSSETESNDSSQISETPAIPGSQELNLVLEVGWDLDGWMQGDCYSSHDSDFTMTLQLTATPTCYESQLALLRDDKEPGEAACESTTSYSDEELPLSLDDPFICVRTDKGSLALIELTELPDENDQPQIVDMFVKVWESD